jgi:hypothetical protein
VAEPVAEPGTGEMLAEVGLKTLRVPDGTAGHRLLDASGAPRPWHRGARRDRGAAGSASARSG